MKIIPLLRVLFFEFGVGFLQSASAQNTPPSAPYIAQAPDPSAWTLTPQSTSTTVHLLNFSYVKSGNVRQETYTLSNNKDETYWYVNGTKYEEEFPGKWTIFVPDASEGVKNYSSDFSELDFVTIANYQGVEDKGGISCFHYVDKKSAREAWIDVKTALPVAYETSGTLWLYLFSQPVAELIVPPDVIRLAGKKYKPRPPGNSGNLTAPSIPTPTIPIISATPTQAPTVHHTPPPRYPDS